MPEKAKLALLTAIAIVVAMALLPPAFFGGTSDPWGKAIYDYQTLITGILATGAAFLTVQQMRKSDRQQEVRHVAVMYQSERRNLKRVRRWYKDVRELVDLGIFFSEEVDSELSRADQKDIVPGYNPSFAKLSSRYLEAYNKLAVLPDKDLALDYLPEASEQEWRNFMYYVSVAAERHPDTAELFDRVGSGPNDTKYRLNVERTRQFIRRACLISKEFSAALSREIEAIEKIEGQMRAGAEASAS